MTATAESVLALACESRSASLARRRGTAGAGQIPEGPAGRQRGAVADLLDRHPEDRLDVSVTASAIILRQAPDGMLKAPRGRYIVIPADARHRCAITAGDNVLLADSQ